MRAKGIIGYIAALLAFGGLAEGAFASPVDFNDPAFATVAGKTSIPVGHLEFCQTYGDECRINTNPVAAVGLTETLWNQLLAVNSKANHDIVPVTDADLYQVAEFWTYPNGYGDCEDYVLDKRRALIELGWPASVLLIAVVRQVNGEGHAVLMVRTDRGDLVLDNQRSTIDLWNATPYQYLKRQSQADAGDWVDIVDDRSAVILASY